MNDAYKFLTENTQVNFVATVNGDYPSLRPFGDPFEFEGRIYIITNKHKDVSKQIAQNNHICIAAYDETNWIRINCEVIDDSDNIEAKKTAIAKYDWMEEAGYTLDNPEFQILYLANAEAEIRDEDGNIIKTWTF